MAAGSQTLTAADAVVKELYDGQRVENEVYDGAPLLAMCPKSTDFYGDVKPLPLQYGNPQGVSAVFATAQTNVYGANYARFQLTRTSLYGVAQIAGEAIEATQNDKGGFVKLFEREIDTMLHQLGRDWHTYLYGNGGGALGQVGSISTDTVTLQNIEDVVNFEVGMEIESSETDGTSGSVQSGTATITAIDREAGTLTSDSNWTAQIAALDAGDFLFRQDNFGAVLTGVAGWVPAAAPSATAFFGLDRTTDSTRLGGVRFTSSSTPASTGLSIEESIQTGASRLARQGRSAKASHLFLNTDRFNDLCVSLGSKVQYIDHKVGKVGFEGIKIACGPSGWVDVYPDYACPDTAGYLLKLSTWEWCGLGESPRIIKQDGLRALRQASADGVEVRFVVRGNLGCKAPGYNCYIELPS